MQPQSGGAPAAGDETADGVAWAPADADVPDWPEAVPWPEEPSWDDVPAWRPPEAYSFLEAGYAVETGEAADPGYAVETGEAAGPGHAAEPGYAAETGEAAEPGHAAEPGYAAETGEAAHPGHAVEPGHAAASGAAATTVSPAPEPAAGSPPADLAPLDLDGPEATTQPQPLVLARQETGGGPEAPDGSGSAASGDEPGATTGTQIAGTGELPPVRPAVRHARPAAWLTRRAWPAAWLTSPGRGAAGLTRRARGAVQLTRRARGAARRSAARAAASGRTFSRVTTVSVLLVVAWLLPAIPLLLGRSFTLAPMLVISIPVALALIVLGLRWVPGRWPTSAQGTGPGDPAPLWPLLCAVGIAAGFAAWQIAMHSQEVIVTRDQGVYLQFGYWIAHHGAASIPVTARAFGGARHGLIFASLGFTQSGTALSPQFMAGLPSVLAGGFWAGGLPAALLFPPLLGAAAVLTFAGLVGRLAGPRWAPAGALVLALALPEQYASRSALSETLAQILLFGGLCLLADSLCCPPAERPARRPWWRTAPGPDIVLAGLGGLALGLTATARIDGLSDVLPAIPVLGVMVAARKPQWLPFGAGLVAGAGYGLADGYVLARPYMDSLASWMRPFGIITAAVTAVTACCVLLWRLDDVPARARRLLAARPLRWLPWAAAELPVIALILFAVRPYVQTVRGDTNRATIAFVGYLQRLSSLPLDPRRMYAEDTLYWVIWYIGLPALLLAVTGIALLGARVTRALATWRDPAGAVRIWALPLLMTAWVTVTVLWRPAVDPDQPWASRRLVPFVLPGLILAAVWAAAWLTAQARQRGAGQFASSAVATLCVIALLLPTALTSFGIGVDPAIGVRGQSSAGGLALHRASAGEAGAVKPLCAAIGSGASVVIVDPTVATEFSQVVRGMCGTPAAQLSRPSPLAVQAVVAGIRTAHRRPVLLGADPAELAGYGAPPRRVLDVTTTQDAHELTTPPTTPWPATYVIWMSQPG